MDEIHWKPEDHTRAATEGILRATQNNGSELKNVALAVENLKDDINHPDDVIEVLEESRELLEEIASKETPKQMAVTLEGVSVVQIKGDKGDKHTDEELLDLIKPLIPDPIKGEKGDEPSDDRIISLIEPLIPDPVKGDPGEKPSEEELKRIIKPLIPPAAKPIKPSADELTEIIKPLIPKPKNGKDGSPDSPDEVVEKVNKSSKKIESNQIIGLPDLIKNFENNSGKGGAGRTPLIIQGAGTKLSDHVTAINFSTNLTAVYSGNGIVTITGSAGSSTPAGSDTEVQFNDGGAFGSDPHFTYDKVNDVLHAHKLAGDATDGLIIESANGTDVGILGAGNTANATWYGNHNYDAATANTIASFGASKTLSSLSTVTYPSLTELSYVKGVTSALQTQLDAKAADSAVVHDTGDETIAGIKTFSSDPIIPDEVYGVGWNGSLEPATKNAIYDKIETLGGGGTVTHTGGALTANAVVLGAGTDDTKVVTGITTDGTSILNLGVNATTIGKVKMFGNTSGDATIQPAAVAGTATVLTLPATSDTLIGKATTDTLTNKTFDADGTGNSITNIENADIKAGAAIAVNKLAALTASELVVTDASGFISSLTGVSSTEAGYLNGVTSALQTQLDGKQPLDADLTTIAGLTATTDNFIVSVASAWASRTPSQVKTTLGLSTADSPQFTGIELGHASDTTLSRSAAGVIAVEGVVIPTISSTSTLTNKRITQRVVTTTDDATAVIDVDVTDSYELSAVANATTFSTTGTPTDGQKLTIRFKDAGVAKGLTWDAVFVAIGVTLPTTTVASKWHYVGCIYNSGAAKWHVVAVNQQA